MSTNITDLDIRTQVQRLDHTARKILEWVAIRPGKRSQVRRFLDHYLPATIKILNAYRQMEIASGPELQTLRDRIEVMLDDLCAVFDEQLGALLRDEAMDISTDITVMEQMLQQEGLGGMSIGGT